MPVYCYKCLDCDHSFETRHSMSFDDQLCKFCKSENVFRVPSLSNQSIQVPSSGPGKIVDKYIEDTKKEIKKEKKDLRNRGL